MFLLLARYLREHVRLPQDEQVIAFDLDLGAAVLRIQDLVALGDVERNPLVAVLVPLAVADRENLAALRLLLGRVGKDDAAGGGLFLFNRLDDQAGSQRVEVHWDTSHGWSFFAGPHTR